MSKIKVMMYSSADKVAGQGVGSAYKELMKMLDKYLSDKLDVNVNKFEASDISHYHTIDPQFYASTFSKKRGRKIGYVHFLPETLEGSIKLPEPIKKVFYKYVIDFYKRMDHLVVVNPSFISKLKNYGIAPMDVTYIPNFVSSDEFYEFSDEDKQKTRLELGYTKDDFIVFGDGQVQARKGIDDFYKLAVNNPQMKFIWAGGFSFGKITDGYDKYKKMVENPPENLVFTGIVSREKLVSYYNIANVFLLPSYDELFPMSMLEAYNCGTPVLVRDLDLYKSILSGYYESGKDYNGLNEKLNELYNDPDKLAQLKKKSHEAADKYSEENLSKIWYKFYKQQSEIR